ncbi:hypothetical protein BD410DRAFT_486448 [Rickenella mellea]|uniref:Transmembrane protein n=1 Tax=Rickenella mellea TaxID=50990 RepID=A0A4Y7QI70_9AGAM|nr:hypothetical protein BD410DRAFT_486448 [Rickenella mellea]
MEEKYLRRFASITSRLRSSYDRIRLSRLFSTYVALTLVFSLFQVTSGFVAFVNDNAASSRFSTIIKQAKIPRRFAFQLPNNTILICDDIRGNRNCKVAGTTFEAMVSPMGTETPTSAVTIASTSSTGFSGSSFSELTATPAIPHDPESVQPPLRFPRRHALNLRLESAYHNRRSLTIQPQLNSSGDIESLTLTGLSGQSQPVTLSLGCIESLAWPDILFRAARREDITMISFHIWVLVMSVASIIYDSIPHLAAAFLGNCASLGWSITQVTLTARFSEVFYNEITVNSCDGVELRSPAVLHRNKMVISGAIITGCFFPVLVFLSYRIFQICRHQSFQRVGATKDVYNIYTFALVFCVCLHLSGFLVISAGLLWLDETLTGVIRKYLPSTALTIIPFVFGIGSNIPWLLMGSNIVFRERRKLMLASLVLGIGLSALWGSTMANPLFQYTLGEWPFFASLSILSFIFLVATTALGFVCRYNFGKGLKHYITVLEVLEEAKFTPGVFSHDPEKAEIDGPSQHRVRTAALAARDSAILSGIPILIPTRALSTTSSYGDAYAHSPSPTENHAGPVQLASGDRVGLSRQTGYFSGNLDGTGVTGLSWLWSRGVAVISRSRTPSLTPVAPSSFGSPPRHSTDTPSSRFSSGSSIITRTSSTTLTSSNAAQFVINLFFPTSTIETPSDEPEQLNISKPLPVRPR